MVTAVCVKVLVSSALQYECMQTGAADEDWECECMYAANATPQAWVSGRKTSGIAGRALAVVCLHLYTLTPRHATTSLDMLAPIHI